MKEIITSPLLLIMIIIGLLYIVAFSLLYLKKAYARCLEMGISKEALSKVIKSSLVFSIVPSLSIVVGLFALIPVLGTIWSWWRLSVIGSLSYETLISSSVASALGFETSAQMLELGTANQFGVVMILMSIGMLSGLVLPYIYVPVAFLYINFADNKCLPQRPYMVRLTIFKRLLVPSTKPLLLSLATAFSTASISFSNPLANEAISFIVDFL